MRLSRPLFLSYNKIEVEASARSISEERERMLANTKFYYGRVTSLYLNYADSWKAVLNICRSCTPLCVLYDHVTEAQPEDIYSTEVLKLQVAESVKRVTIYLFWSPETELMHLGCVPAHAERG